MFKKAAVLMIALAICFSGASCTQKNGYRSSGKPYRNESPDGVVDGYYYKTEENQTDNFIAYKDQNGETVLYIMRDGKISPYSTDGLCNVTPGKAYTITYDAQLHWGGLAGIHDYYFLTVYSCEECSDDKVFENGVSWNIDWHSEYPVPGVIEGNRFLAFKGAFGGYDVFTEKNGKLHFNDRREVKVPVKVNGATEELQINVFCNWTLPNKYITDKMLSRQYGNETKFVFKDCYHSDDERGSSDNDFDTIENLATGSHYYKNQFRFSTDGEKPAEGKRVITYDEIMSKTAEELGLEDWLYENIYYGCLDRAKARDSDYNRGSGPARKCDVLIFTGNFPRDAGIFYDKDLRLYVTGSKPMDEDAGEEAFQYYILFINSDFNAFLPQG